MTDQGEGDVSVTTRGLSSSDLKHRKLNQSLKQFVWFTDWIGQLCEPIKQETLFAAYQKQIKLVHKKNVKVFFTIVKNFIEKENKENKFTTLTTATATTTLVQS
jgi:hypothetical protein